MYFLTSTTATVNHAAFTWTSYAREGKTIFCALMLMLGSLWATPLFSQSATEGNALGEVLNADGTLKAGASGSFNAKGFHMQTGKGGEPVFRPQVAGDERWDSTFYLNGINGSVNAIAINGNDLYVGGQFRAAGSLVTDNIAKWNGSVWSALGRGVNGNVYAIAVNGDDVYVGGDFTDASGTAANNIAKWNGSVWSSLGSGTGGYVPAIAVSGNDVYVGGSFASAGGISVNNIAKWNGSSWSALANGVSDTYGDVFVSAITVSGNDVYVGGLFTKASDVSVNSIAKWNGSRWDSLGSGVRDMYGNGVINAIAVSGNEIYVGGYFIEAGEVSAKNVAKWSGSNWSALSDGVSGFEFGGTVTSMNSSGSDVFVGGFFTNAGGISAKKIAKWSGGSWDSLGGGLNGEVFAIAAGGGNVYVGGGFRIAGNSSANSIAKWNGSDWLAIGSNGNGITGNEIEAMAISGNDVYVGGNFIKSAGNTPVNGIAKWDGNGWSSLKSGVDDDGSIYAISVSGSDVYVGGTFTSVDGISANNIAKWNGSTWSALGNGISSGIYAIATSGSDVYVGGGFTSAGSAPAKNVAKWNGINWSALGDGISGGNFDGVVKTIAISGNDVYVGGDFAKAGNVPVSNIAKWNGSNWDSLGSGVKGMFNTRVYGIAISGSDVYVGGLFTTAGNVAANGIAKWNGSAWSALDSGMDGYVLAIAASGNDVYVGGSFTSVGDVSAYGIAKWDGSAWSALGSGIGGGGGSPFPFVYAIAVSGSDLYVGGGFGYAGGKPSFKFARYSTATSSVEDSPDATTKPIAFDLRQNYPNPFNPATRIAYTLPAAGLTALKIYDLTGRLVQTLVNRAQPAGRYEATFNGNTLSSGMYFYRLSVAGNSGTFTKTMKMLLVK